MSITEYFSHVLKNKLRRSNGCRAAWIKLWVKSYLKYEMDHFWHLTARDRWDFRIFEMSFLKILRGDSAAGGQSTTCLLHSFQIIRSLLFLNIFYELEDVVDTVGKQRRREKETANGKSEEKSESHHLNGKRNIIGTGLVKNQDLFWHYIGGCYCSYFKHPRWVIQRHEPNE